MGKELIFSGNKFSKGNIINNNLHYVQHDTTTKVKLFNILSIREICSLFQPIVNFQPVLTIDFIMSIESSNFLPSKGFLTIHEKTLFFISETSYFKTSSTETRDSAQRSNKRGFL